MTIDLQNKKILVTRAENQAQYFSRKIKKFGGDPYQVPLIKIRYLEDPNFQEVLRKVQQYDWLFFTSANSIEIFFNLSSSYFDINLLANKKIAVVGQKTNEALNRHGHQATFIPTTYNAETMVREFLNMDYLAESILFVRGKRSSDIIPTSLKKAKHNYDCLTVYETAVLTENRVMLNQALIDEGIDYITFTSPSIVNAFFSLSDDIGQIEEKQIVCIGTTTAQTVIEQGVKNILIPEVFTIEGMLTEISNHIAQKG